MDLEGYVTLQSIIGFNRLQRLGVSPHTVLDALFESEQLEMLLPWALRVAGPQSSDIARLSDSVVLQTKIRPRKDPQRWVQRPGQ